MRCYSYKFALITLCLVVLCPSTLAQFRLDPALDILSGRQDLGQSNPQQPNIRPRPLEPSGFPNPAPRYGNLPAPDPASNEKFIKIVRSGTLNLDGEKVSLSEGAEFVYKGYRVFANEVEGNTNTNVFVLTGQVKVIGQDAIIVGESVRVDFDDRRFFATDSDAQIRPSVVEGLLLQDLYVRGPTLYGTPSEIFGEDTHTTTCNYDVPHFEFIAKRSTIRPGKRAIFRDARLTIQGKTVLGLPYISIPLNRPDARYIPEVGQGQVEGYFIRSRWGIPISPSRNSLDARIDYYTNLGAGVGGELEYESKSIRGNVNAYHLTGDIPTLNVNTHHEQDFGWMRFLLDNDFQRDNYLVAASSTILNTRSQLIFPQGRNQSTLRYLRTSNEGTSFESVNQTVGLTDTRQFGRKTRTNLDVNWTRSESFFTTDTVEREQIDLRFRGVQDLTQAELEFAYQRSIPVGEINNFFSSSDRTPVVTLRSDARRLFGPKEAQNFPFRTELSVGEFADFATQDQIQRGSFDFNVQKNDTGRKRFRINYTARFRQSYYSDDTAQFLLNLSTHFAYSLGRDTSLNLRYNYLRPYGFTPLQIDRTGQYNNITADLSFRPIRSFLLGAQTGYDILRLDRKDTPWQSIGIRAEYRPVDYVQFRALSTYDTFQQAWSNVRLDLSYRPGATFVSVGARYDAIRHTWGNANLFVDGLKWGRLKTSVLMTYNGFLEEFEARHFSFTYDLHDAEAILQIIDNPIGFNSGQQVLFMLRLKAFPFSTPFGVGNRGQGFGTGTGRGF